MTYGRRHASPCFCSKLGYDLYSKESMDPDRDTLGTHRAEPSKPALTRSYTGFNRPGHDGPDSMIVAALRRLFFRESQAETKEPSSKMGRIRRLVLDTLKPHEPSIIDLADQLSDLDGISAVNISIYEMDRKVENAKITIEGEDVRFEIISELIEEMGGAIHSVDEVVAGRHIIDDAETLQD